MIHTATCYPLVARACSQQILFYTNEIWKQENISLEETSRNKK